MALQLTLGGFIIPFIIGNDQALLLQGPAYWVIWRTAISVLGIYVLGGAAMGWYFTRAAIWERVLGAAGALLLVIPMAVTDYTGLAVCLFVLAYQYHKARKQKAAAAAQPAES
jgi:TRAP-type uncharacterized transport system fused permease subunit